jgi:hypothetical protein
MKRSFFVFLSLVCACGPRGDSGSSAETASCNVSAPVDELVAQGTFLSPSAFTQLSLRESFQFFGDDVIYIDPMVGNPFGFGGKGGQLIAVPKSGGAPRVLYTAPEGRQLLGFKTDGVRLLVMQLAVREATPNNLSTVDIIAPESGAVVVSSPAGTTWNPLFARFIAMDTTDLYLQMLVKTVATGSERQEILRVPLSGAPQQVLASKASNFGMALSQRAGDHIYFMGSAGFGSLYRTGLTPGTEVRLTDDANNDGVDDDAKCVAPFFDTSGVFCPRLLGLEKRDADGENAVSIRDETTLEPTPPASTIGDIQGDKIYLATSGSKSSPWPLQRITTNGGAAENLACARRAIVDVRADANHVYWLEKTSETAIGLYRTQLP